MSVIQNITERKKENETAQFPLQGNRKILQLPVLRH